MELRVLIAACMFAVVLLSRHGAGHDLSAPKVDVGARFLQGATNEPTRSPSAEPTRSPSAKPTRSPSAKPTRSPSAKPTRSPSAKPTSSPSAKPTKSPTPKPTRSPTTKPTKSPTSTPTRSPSASPTTPAPTRSPSTQPTPAPSAAPSPRPTASPTTAFPTASPTPSPSAAPSVRPTASPSRSPSRRPSRAPTRAPSPSPTVRPTRAPTGSPTPRPTEVPTRTPSRSPSRVPSAAPSRGPTARPSASPSQSPSASPSAAPVVPSASPTRAPTALKQGPQGASGLADSGGFCEEDFVEFPAVDALQALSYVFAAAGTALSVAGAVLIYVHRDAPIIMMSQRMFLALFSLGIAGVNLSMFPRISGISSPSKARCGAHLFLFYFAMVFTLSCICAKEWRAWLVFERSKSLEKIKVPNSELFRYIGAAQVGIVVLLAATLAASPPAPNPCDDFRCEPEDEVMSYVLFCCMLILTVVALVLACMTRNVPSVAGEASGIAITVSFTVFALVLVGIIFVTDSVSIQLETWLTTFSVLACTVVAMASIVLRKWFWIHLSSEQVKDRFLDARAASSSSSSARAAPPPPGLFSSKATSQSPPPQTTCNTSSSGETAASPPPVGSPSSVQLRRAEPTLTQLDPTPPPFTRLEPAAEASEKDGQPDGGASVEDRLEEARSRGFVISERYPWEELIDRATGDTFWLNVETAQISSEEPTQIVET